MPLAIIIVHFLVVTQFLYELVADCANISMSKIVTGRNNNYHSYGNLTHAQLLEQRNGMVNH